MEIQGTVIEARRMEATAHNTLKSALQDANTIAESLSSPVSWIGKGLAYAGAAHGTAAKLAGEAEQQTNFAEQYQRWSADSTMPASAREANLERLFKQAGMKADAAKSNARLLANAGDTTAGKALLDPLTRTVVGDAEGAAAAAGKEFPIVGIAMAGVLTGIDIEHGKPVGKSVEVNFGGVAAGVGASAATGAVLTAAGVVGAPVTVAAVGVGFVAAWAWGYFQDHNPHDFFRDLPHRRH